MTTIGLSSVSLSAAGGQALGKDAQGITVKTPAEIVRLDVYSDDIIQVRATPLAQLPDYHSFMVVPEGRQEAQWTAEDAGRTAVLKTRTLQVSVDKQTGAVSFADATGKPLLGETAAGRVLTPVEEMGEQTYTVQQQWDARHIQAILGLGAHQSGIANYKGRDAILQQYNVIDVVPFFITDKQFGILWDNNSITRFGDPRPWRELDALKLYDAQGNEGALTAEYFADGAFSEPFLTRSESKIIYDFEEDRPALPKGFDIDKGSIRWSGSFEAAEDGIYKFQAYGSHYMKVWLDGKLVVDRWRQNWMPWTNDFLVPAKAGERHKLVVEWICNGGYASLECLPPEPKELDERITLTSEVGEMVNYYFVRGNDADGVIGNYRRLTGQAPMPPKWAMGLFQSRERYKSQQEVLDVVREYRKRDLPMDCIVQDWFYWREDQWGSHEFDPARFPDPKGMMDTLHNELNATMMISVWAKFYTNTKHYKTFADKGWVYPRNVEKGDKDWIGYPWTFFDAFNEQAGRMYWDQMNEKLFDIGIDAWWLDATEPDVKSNVGTPERKLLQGPTAAGTPARIFNAFSINSCRWVYEGQRKADPSKRVFILTRSAYAGQQRYGAATWTGDVATRWIDLGNQITAGTNFCASGVPYWTTDIGGFAVERRHEIGAPDDRAEFQEIVTRWLQFGVFNPLFRIHGQFPFREIYEVAPEGSPAYEAMAEYDRLRYRLMPYIYSMAGMVTHDNYTILRGLLLDFPDDVKAINLDDQFMFGPAFLVCPVKEYKARSREVYLPQGADWYDFHTGRKYTGGQTLTADAPLSDLPLYVRAGSLVLFGPDIEYAAEKNDPIEIRIYPGADATFSLYEDENDGYGYEDGAFARIPLQWDDASRTLTIGARAGSFPGMLKERTFNVVIVEDGQGVGKDHAREPQKTVNYNGSAHAVQL